MTKEGWVVSGVCDAEFEPLRRAFEDNFRLRDELGASVSVVVDGKVAADLWGGFKNEGKTLVWEQDTLVSIQSISKGLLAIIAAILIEKKLLDPNEYVAHYWPEFARAGKESVTVEHLISHQAGIIYMDHARDGALFDKAHMLEALTLQEPSWKPGAKGGYHSSTYLLMVSHLLEMATRKTPNELFQEYLGRPLGLKTSFGLPPSRWGELAEFVAPKDDSVFLRISTDSRLGRAWKGFPKNMDDLWNSPQIKENEAHCFGNGRELARIFGALAKGGEIDQVRICSPATVENLRTIRWDGICPLIDLPIRMAFGLFLNTPGFVPTGPNLANFGSFGAGGSGGFGDPDLKLGFGYAMNRMCSGMDLGPRYQALVDALYECV